MSTITAFAPAPNQAFEFQPTLDGTTYTAIVTWNVFGQRYYINLYTLAGTLIFALPLIGSPADADISISAGYFTSTLIYRPSTGNFEVSP